VVGDDAIVYCIAYVLRYCVASCACCVLRVACCVLRVACCVLRVVCCVLRVACCVLSCGVLSWLRATVCLSMHCALRIVLFCVA
jgi:hypothetical protein